MSAQFFSRRVAFSARLFLAVVLAGLASPAAMAVEVQDGADHPLVTRFPGSALVGYSQQEWDATVFPLSADINTSTQELKKAVTVEGKVTRLYYLAPVGKTPVEVFRSYQQAFAKAGLKTVFNCDSNCGQLFFRWRFGKPRDEARWAKTDLYAAEGGSRWNIRDLIAEGGRGFYGTLARGGSLVHVFVYTSIAGYAPTNAAATVIEIAEPKAMQTDQVKVDAEAMAKGLTAEGRIVLGGVYFDTGKATLKPESDDQLREMAKLLQSHPALQVFIVGHTDNQGSFEANLALSKQRAEAVRNELVTRFKADAKRITPFGAANVSPVAANGNEAGRALNRRVELVAR